MSADPTPNPPAPAAQGPSFYRWLMIVLGIFIALVVLYRATDTGPQMPPRQRLPKMSIIPPFTLTERSGKIITNSDLSGKVWVADFIYTTCPGPCPLVSAALAKIQQNVAGDPHVQLVTFTVDPQTDTPQVLAAYADHFHADPNKWWFLTGPEKPLYALIQNGFLQAVQDNHGQPLEDGQGTVTHSTYFALVDANGIMRGAYQSQDPDECKQLLSDITALEQEAGL
ncbi:MAG TPA: SCO family protein [Candidatus Methylacidiphilales bacterium]|jgi:protein SCO1/2|nr:SCO family protein [Candidatus Methylacidiphilales bacterium]